MAVTDIGPGDWVECRPPAGYRGELNLSSPDVKVVGVYPRPGGVYCVRELGSFMTSGGVKAGIRLAEVVVSYPGHPDCWFSLCCFRPIYRPRERAFDHLLQPVKEEA